MAQPQQKRKFKEYRLGFSIALVIFILGIALEWLSNGRGMALPAWPMNLFVGLSFAFCIVFIHYFYSEMNIVKWMSRVPASISSITLFTVLTLILGLTRQNNPDAPEILKLTGLNHIRYSYTFLLSGLYLLATLGLVILRRVKKFNYRNLGFLLNHLGLWIIVLAGSLGAGDLTRLQVYVNENESVWYGYETSQHPKELPFTIKLLDFNIDFYSPKLAYIESATMSLPENVENNMVMIEEGMEVEIANWEIQVSEFYPGAVSDSSGTFHPSDDTIAVPVAKLKAVHKENKESVEGYISSGGIMKAPVFLKLNEGFSLAMSQPEPKEYSSLIEIMNSGGEIDTTLLLVNKPVKVDGWNLYQLSYDERMGKWSRLSIIEAIRDPWLPLIYIGIIMVILGALYLFTIGKTPKED